MTLIRRTANGKGMKPILLDTTSRWSEKAWKENKQLATRPKRIEFIVLSSLCQQAESVSQVLWWSLYVRKPTHIFVPTGGQIVGNTDGVFPVDFERYLIEFGDEGVLHPVDKKLGEQHHQHVWYQHPQVI